ncbi:unnamed protein product [Acanthoscelides obtectus]|uniref:Uncharacterized protein n=1 Tax=Acanthoscelides obtectus TaxID=200917 RepID=A0A9P0K0F5_ACAOB|nr:unnamed protein product [Acanthoscelides obtectus]CAK1669986.1 hypothetical protein AOBTE_LOCUS27341 [Acanthoscelides obtectus]
MALGLRSINKFTTLSTLAAPRSINVNNTIHRQISLTPCEQYSTRLNTKLCYYDKRNDIQTGVIDNRESVHDTVTKENLSTIDHLHIEGIDTSLKRFSKPVPEANDNERLFAEQDDNSNPNKPSPDKLLHVYNVLGDNLPKLFIQPLDYTIYHADIIFEDNIRNIRTVWYDGFSTFYVNAEGKIVKHVADKMMPDSDTDVTPPKAFLKTAKLALIVGIIPKFSELTA